LAFFSIGQNQVAVPENGSIWTNLQTFFAQSAASRLRDQFWIRRLAFRVMTPKTAQWTAFEKDCCTDARSIMDGEAADIKDQSPSVIQTSQPLLMLP
jgi:hypothetical protein